MPIDPITGYALIQGGQAIGNYLFNRRKRPAFEETSYAKRLQQIMKEGRLTEAEEAQRVSKVSRGAHAISSKAAAGYRGRLASMGMLDSVAGARGLADIQTKPIDAISAERERIGVEESAAKAQAKDQFALMKDTYTEQVRRMRETDKSNLVSGLLGAAGTFGMGKINQKLYENLDVQDPEKVNQFIRSSPDPEAAINQIYKMQLGSYYSGGGRKKGNVADVVSKYKAGGMGDDEFLATLIGMGLGDEEIDMLLASLRGGQ